MTLINAIVELYRKCATELPSDVTKALVKAMEVESNPNAKKILTTLLDNAKLSRQNSTPICQDTGTPIFYVKCPVSADQIKLKQAIIKATELATIKIPLRPNAVEPTTGKNIGNYPLIKFSQWNKKQIEIKLMLKGGGSENVGMIYKLPNNILKAERSLSGIRKCVIDAVQQAQGNGCPPEIVGVGIGGTQDTALELAKLQFFRDVYDINPDKKLGKLENQLYSDLNKLGIGPMGLGGKITVLSVKIGSMYRHPASFFVAVSFMCWACRRYTLVWEND